MNSIGIIGGGAAGFFCAANLNSKKYKTYIFEQGQKVLKKVKISGGGRCNVTHNIFDEQEFCTHYPRGQKELRSPFNQFKSLDTLRWFKKRGVNIVAEPDGRMFPTTNDSQTIINCLKDEAKKNKVELMTNHKVTHIEVINDKFCIHFSTQEPITVNKLLLCTGSSEKGYGIAESLGHTITERAPSLFSFKIKHPILKDLSGISFPNTILKLQFMNYKKKFMSDGPLLITHWGLSGPAILKLSAWAAREMKNESYKAKLLIDWVGSNISDKVNTLKIEEAKSNVSNSYPQILPKRFWENLLIYNKIKLDKKWADVSKKDITGICNSINSLELNCNGQNRFKEEFVECGGVNLKEINFKTMESKITKNLYFAGELLDVDGVTGGFNFQNAWTTSWIVANNITS